MVSRRAAPSWAGGLSLGLLLLPSAAVVAAPSPPPVAQRGIALGLFSADPEHRYEAYLDEIAAQGATHVSLVQVWYQHDIRADHIGPRPGYSASLATLGRSIDAAHQRGLQVMLFPILGIEQRAHDEWRGRIQPGSWDAWFASYRDYILRMAGLAAEHDAEILSVGSELLSTESMRDRWTALIAQVRRRYPGQVLYSANWDHYQPVRFWDQVDLMGVTGYYELTRRRQPSQRQVVEAWRRWREPLLAHARRVGLPLVFTEIGYPSIDGANIYPWDETRKEAVDVEEQALCLRAFIEAWDQPGLLHGVFFWNWYGAGGASDGSYTPRGKPATKVIRRWFAEQAARARAGAKEKR